MISQFDLLVGILLICALALSAVFLRVIDISGALSGAIITFLAFLAGGFAWFFLMVVFVAVSSALTRFKYDYKRRLGFAQDKMGMRSWPNSIANGGVSMIASIGELYTHSELFAVMFLTSVAAAMADTLATEVGLLSHSSPRLITHPFTFVEPGTSGGITTLGNAAALLTAICMTILGLGLSIVKEGNFVSLGVAGLFVTMSAVFGVFFDSFLGATIQETNRCVDCGKLTENSSHHGKPTIHVRGFKRFNNNVVNFVGILGGTILAVAAYFLFVML